MKFFEVYDFNDKLIARCFTKQECIKHFREWYPTFEPNSVESFIYEIEIEYNICLPEYEGIVSKKAYTKGRNQLKVIAAIRHCDERFGRMVTTGQIKKIFKLDIGNLRINNDFKDISLRRYSLAIV